MGGAGKAGDASPNPGYGGLAQPFSITELPFTMVVVVEQAPSMMYLYVDWVVEHQLSLRRCGGDGGLSDPSTVTADSL